MEQDLARHMLRALRWVGEALAVALASSVAGTAALALICGVVGLGSGASLAGTLEFLLVAGAFALIASFAVTAAAVPLIALPAMLLLRRIEAETLGAYAVAGAAGGVLLAVPLGWGDEFIAILLLLCPAYGALAAAFFFLFCRRRRRHPATGL